MLLSLNKNYKQFWLYYFPKKFIFPNKETNKFVDKFRMEIIKSKYSLLFFFLILNIAFKLIYLLFVVVSMGGRKP